MVFKGKLDLGLDGVLRLVWCAVGVLKIVTRLRVVTPKYSITFDFGIGESEPTHQQKTNSAVLRTS